MHDTGLPFMAMCTRILHKVKWYIISFGYIFHKIVGNHLDTMFG